MIQRVWNERGRWESVVVASLKLAANREVARRTCCGLIGTLLKIASLRQIRAQNRLETSYEMVPLTNLWDAKTNSKYSRSQAQTCIFPFEN